MPVEVKRKSEGGDAIYCPPAIKRYGLVDCGMFKNEIDKGAPQM